MSTKVAKKPRLTADQDVVNGKVGWGEKISYSLGEMGQNFLLMLGTYFSGMYFLTVVGLDSLVIAWLVIVCKGIDALTDIGLGILFDRYEPRFARNWKNGGKWRGWLLVMMPLGLLAYLMMFNFPIGSSMAMLYVFYALMQVVQGVGMSGTDFTHSNIMTRMTQNRKERNMISMLRGIGVMIATMFVMYIVPMMVPSTNVDSDKYIAPGTTEYVEAWQSGLTTVVIICGAVFVISMLLAIIFTKERVVVDEQKKQAAKTRTLKESFAIVKTNKAMLAMIIVGVASTIASTLVAATQAYWLTYYMGDLQKMWLFTTISGAVMTPVIILTPFVANKIGKKNTYFIGLMIMAVCSIGRLFVPQGNFLFAFLLTAPTGIGTGLFMSLAASLGSDSIEYGEWKTGERAEGVISSVSSFVTKSFSMIVPSIPFFILGLTDFDATVSVQSDLALFGINLCFTIIPAVFYLISAVCFWFLYPINKKVHTQMIEDLTVARAARAAEVSQMAVDAE